jgi:tryptophan halogenase
MTVTGEVAPIRSVAVLGGGTAGYFTAIFLKRRHPSLDVTVIEAPNIPIIGVGEATTTLLPPFLFRDLGIDPVELHARVRPTFKLGICFDWGPPRAPRFGYPFGQAEPLAAVMHDGSLETQSLAATLMASGRVPIEENAGQLCSLLPEFKFAYHLANGAFVSFLSEHAKRNGVRHRSMEIVRAETDPATTRVEQLHTRDGQTVKADLYVDASGFRAALIGDALGGAFESFGSSLFCDSAIIGDLPVSKGSEIKPCTGAERMSAGWTWDIGVEGERHRGYVYASAFSRPEEAEAELVRRNPGIGRLWSLRFRSGRRREFVRGNVATVGNAYGFVEPLESTALHMVILHLAWLGALLGPTATQPAAAAITRVNERVGAHWDSLRWFLAMHYKLSPRCETPFWRTCHHEADLSGFDPILERFRREGVTTNMNEALAGDPAFGLSGLATMALGLDPDTYRPKSEVPLEAWRDRLARQRAFADRALPHRRGLEVLRERPDLLRALTAPSSWCSTEEETARIGHGLTARLPHDGR